MVCQWAMSAEIICGKFQLSNAVMIDDHLCCEIFSVINVMNDKQ
jgi:hypothetical protein